MVAVRLDGHLVGRVEQCILYENAQDEAEAHLVTCQLAGHWKNEVFHFSSALSDLLARHKCADYHSRSRSMQLSEQIRVQWMWKSCLPACFGHHPYGIRQT
jgi:hypothetical protein